ncbi:HEAT repeat domain-containing protein [Kribbella sandramycini]|uniref:HEAT repeat domain-containing protein n=1 Tax=Kribbella sandramycini TaxID=60450 RepID=A0A7Y4L3G5_9ACTN|nr:HEAT repeat domain-containing protein [Kribbella sandramycini]MBB6566583.1 HEAT repeat protein [Kribbella sandramycini]NOL42762.1 HEAT repeat domain-containing protein [Kribbella sandramycini]
MTATPRQTLDPRLLEALTSSDSSRRLKTVLTLGSEPDPALIDALIERCAVEPDFFVRDMLTWALVRLPADRTVPRLLAELRSERPQARSQALHTLSKIGDPSVWPSITTDLLHDADDEVARTAWRTAVVLVPAGQEAALAAELVRELGRGGRDVQLSLSRALIELGEVILPVLAPALASRADAVRLHARATEQLLADPESTFAVEEAKRVYAMGPDADR